MQIPILCCALVWFFCVAELASQTPRSSSRPTSRPSSRPTTPSGLRPSSGEQKDSAYPRDLWREDFDRPSIEGVAQVGGKAELSRVGTALVVDVIYDEAIRRVASSVSFKPGHRLPFQRASHLLLRLRSTPEGGDGVSKFRVNCFDAERRAAFSKGLSIKSGEWVDVSVSLPAMVPYYGVPRWDVIEKIGLQFYTPGRFEIESVALVADSAEASPHWREETIRVMAFDDLELRVVRRGAFVVMTDAKRVSDEVMESLAKSVDSLSDLLGEDFENAAVMKRSVYVFLFERESRYRAFWSRVAAGYSAQIESPGEFHNAQLGLVTSWCKKRPRAVDPKWVESCMKMVIAQRLGIAARSNWLSDGLATYYRFRESGDLLHTQKDVRKGFGSVRKMTKITVLTSGGRLDSLELWQAASLVAWMMNTAERRAGLVEFVGSAARSGDVRLLPEAHTSFGLSLPEIEKEWTAWGREMVFGRKKAASGK